MALQDDDDMDWAVLEEIDRICAQYESSKSRPSPSNQPASLDTRHLNQKIPNWNEISGKLNNNSNQQKPKDQNSARNGQRTLHSFLGKSEEVNLSETGDGVCDSRGNNSRNEYKSVQNVKPSRSQRSHEVRASSIGIGCKAPPLSESSEPGWAALPSSSAPGGSHEFDSIAGARWIFPVSESRPKREYQFQISRTALFSNTLVCLPTGLGKTLIAAVVMLNFHRWFPRGKIVFLAPTKPLVRQQMEACHGIAGIPKDDMACMTGATPVQQRSDWWKSRRVFFMTGQTLQNDIIEHAVCPKEAIVCLVIDEAHRASGKYAYNIVVEELMKAGSRLRILALTATPGSTHDRVQEVIDGLRLSCLELRCESDPDVKRYTFQRQEEVKKVPLSAGTKEIESLLCEELKVYTSYLSKNVDSRISLQCHSFVLQSRKTAFESSRAESGQIRDQQALAAFANAHFFASLAETLVVYGIGPSIRKIEENQDFRVKLDSPRAREAYTKMIRIKEKGFSSAKLQVMEAVVASHFKTKGTDKTKVIVFTNLRESVTEIVEVLNARQEEGVRAKEFIGQQTGKTKGMSQKKQIQIVEDFRKGEFNVLVATSIGEEGLDISQVDLVIAYDVMSIGRMTQRMGRTGRQRQGKVVILASEGAELRKYKTEKKKGEVLSKDIRFQGADMLHFHPSPRMVPHTCMTPEPFEEEIQPWHWLSDVDLAAIGAPNVDSEGAPEVAADGLAAVAGAEEWGYDEFCSFENPENVLVVDSCTLLWDGANEGGTAVHPEHSQHDSAAKLQDDVSVSSERWEESSSGSEHPTEVPEGSESEGGEGEEGSSPNVIVPSSSMSEGESMEGKGSLAPPLSPAMACSVPAGTPNDLVVAANGPGPSESPLEALFRRKFCKRGRATAPEHSASANDSLEEWDKTPPGPASWKKLRRLRRAGDGQQAAMDASEKGKRSRTRACRPSFIDQEAEESGGESGGEEDSNDDASLDSFIVHSEDGQQTPPPNTSKDQVPHTPESVDQMAIYRQSLLSQLPEEESPVVGQKKRRRRALQFLRSPLGLSSRNLNKMRFLPSGFDSSGTALMRAEEAIECVDPSDLESEVDPQPEQESDHGCSRAEGASCHEFQPWQGEAAAAAAAVDGKKEAVAGQGNLILLLDDDDDDDWLAGQDLDEIERRAVSEAANKKNQSPT